MSLILIVGGSDAGISPAPRERELDSDIDVALVLEDAYQNFSIFGIPYHVSDEMPD